MGNSADIFEIPDNENTIVVLTKYQWQHILERREYDFSKYLPNIKDVIQNPDIKGRKESHPDIKVYVQKNKKNRNSLSSYLVVYVDSNNMIRTALFKRKLERIIQ